MPIEIKMPALSPTMEEGTLAKWLVKEGDTVKSGDLLAEIETDKATMEFEAVDEGTIVSLAVAAGTDGVKVGTVIATLAGEGEDASTPSGSAATPPEPKEAEPFDEGAQQVKEEAAAKAGEPTSTHPKPQAGAPVNTAPQPQSDAPASTGERVKASPLARRVAAEKGIELNGLNGSGPNGRIVRADVEGAGTPAAAPVAVEPATAPPAALARPTPVAKPTPVGAGAAKPVPIPDIPYEAAKLSNIRKVIARRLTESKQTVPHIYLTVDVRLDALLKLRGELNQALAKRDVKLSVNDLLVKALALALMQVPKCNVMFTPDQLISFSRADISVAVSTPNGLITPIVKEADSKGVAAISTEMKDLAARARDGKLKPDEFQGGTASISNMGMYGIKQFDAVINPPQGMILAVGSGEPRPYVIDGALGVATVMSATGSFDHRAIDGADGAELMAAFKALCEAPLGLVA